MNEDRRLIRPHRFAETSCSQCGGDLGPGNYGMSHCEDHMEDEENDEDNL